MSSRGILNSTQLINDHFMKRLPLLAFSLFSLAIPSAFAQVNAVGYATVTFPPGFSMFSNPLGSTDNSIAALFRSGAPDTPEGTVIYRLTSSPSPSLPEPANPAGLRELLAKLPTEFNTPVIIRRETGDIVLEWTGRLQAATEVTGPYQAVSDLSGPLRLTPSAPRSFWRATASAALTISNFTANIYEAGEWSTPSDRLQPGEGAILFNPSDKPFIITYTGQILQGLLGNRIPEGWSIRSCMAPINGGVTSKTGLQLTAGDRLIFLEDGQFKEFAAVPGGGWLPSEPQNSTSKAFLIFANKARTWEIPFMIRP